MVRYRKDQQNGQIFKFVIFEIHEQYAQCSLHIKRLEDIKHLKWDSVSDTVWEIRNKHDWTKFYILGKLLKFLSTNLSSLRDDSYRNIPTVAEIRTSIQSATGI